MESLQKVSHKLAEEVYKSTASQQAAQGASGAQPGDEQPAAGAQQEAPKEDKKEDVIDADFKAEDESK